MLALLAQTADDLAPLLDELGRPVGLLVVAFFLIRFATSQADKRASVAEAREGICSEALKTCVGTNTALATEVRANHADVKAGIQNILDHIRH